MKKNILMLMLGAMAIAGCQNADVVFEKPVPADQDSVAISFDNSFISNLLSTRAGSTALSDYMQSMGVYGWQSFKGEAERNIFNDCLVSYADATGWTYSPAKYWDKQSSYRFYAYAPHNSESAAQTVSFDETANLFSIKNVTLKGDNTMHDSAMTAPYNNFASVGDIDWLIDRDGQNMSGSNPQLVMFEMQHILAKLNVSVQLSSSLANDSYTTVTIDNMTISDFASKADFNQTANAEGEWSIDNTAPRYTLNGTENATVAGPKTYIIESLIIPQSIGSGIKAVICYTFTTSERTEHYTFKFDLNDAFDSSHWNFQSGCSYNLNLIIGTDVITFDSGVSDWTEKQGGNFNL